MEMKNDEFQKLQSKVDKISSELDKQHRMRAVNTKWMLTVGAVIVAALGYTNFVQLPKEAAEAAREQIGPETIDEAKEILSRLGDKETQAGEIGKRLGEISDLKRIANLPVGTIIPSMLKLRSFAKAVGDDPNHFDPRSSNWALADGRVIPGSLYAEYTKEPKVPNLCGLFLRGLNVERSDGKGDPDGSVRTPGDYQSDSFKEHNHLLPIQGSKESQVWVVRREDRKGDYMQDPHFRWTSAEGEKETRPKNAAVYYYIKIN